MFKYHKNLPPTIWDGRVHINPLVSQSLQMIAYEYIRYLGNIMGLPVVAGDIADIIIHGSATNYYWDAHSDIDICIVADLSRVRAKLNGLNDYLLMRALTGAWKRTFAISIFGRGVDITIVDKNDGYDQTHKKVGSCYSLTRDEWIHTPRRLTRDEIAPIKHMARRRARIIMRDCRYMLRHKMPAEYIDTYLTNLQHSRKQSMGLQYTQPITSTTMAFKMVRNTGVLRKLRARAKEQRSKKYCLD